MALPDQWAEYSFVAVTRYQTTINPTLSPVDVIQASCKTDTIDITWGEKAIDQIATVGGCRFLTFTPEALSTVTLELIPNGGREETDNFWEWFSAAAQTGTDPYVLTNTISRYKFRVAILFTEMTPVTDANGATTGFPSYRIIFKDCYMTGFTTSFTDDVLKASVTFTCPPFDGSGTGLFRQQETPSTGLSALSDAHYDV